jgi:hypothetical protein
VPTGATYHLDDEGENNVKQYDGKQVKLVGNEGDKRQCLHVLNIQLM